MTSETQAQGVPLSVGPAMAFVDDVMSVQPNSFPAPPASVVITFSYGCHN
jgi:hypothetical protein